MADSPTNTKVSAPDLIKTSLSARNARPSLPERPCCREVRLQEDHRNKAPAGCRAKYRTSRKQTREHPSRRPSRQSWCKMEAPRARSQTRHARVWRPDQLGTQISRRHSCNTESVRKVSEKCRRHPPFFLGALWLHDLFRAPSLREPLSRLCWSSLLRGGSLQKLSDS